MRRSFNDHKLIYDDNGIFVGVNLGWDFTAEHEWGVKRLRQEFGMNENKKYGIARSQISHIPEKYGFDENRLIIGYPLERAVYEEKKELNDYKEKQLVTAWSDLDFGIKFPKENKKEAVELHEAFLRKDIALVFANPEIPVFSNRGMCFLIVSKLPKEIDKSMTEQQKESERLEKEDKKTGIKDRLKEANRDYFACSPRFCPEKEQERTKYSVIYWLNPRDQQKNNSGWYTVEELDQWIKNEGPIPMKVKK